MFPKMVGTLDFEDCIRNARAVTLEDDKECYKDFLDINTLETHVYINYGVFGGLTLILIVATFFACGMIFDLRKKFEERGYGRNDNAGFVGTGAGGGKNTDPLQQRGYAAYTGSQSGGPARQQSIVVAPPIQGNQYGAPAPNRNSYGPTQGQGGQRQGGYDSGYERGAAAGGARGGGNKQDPDWGQRFDKGMAGFEKAQSGFGKFQEGTQMADQMGLSQQAFGGNINDMGGMEMAGDVSGYAGDAAKAAKLGKSGMGAFKNKGFQNNSSSSKLW